jgi:hypothetical protein
LLALLGLTAVFKSPCGGDVEVKLTPPDIHIQVDGCQSWAIELGKQAKRVLNSFHPLGILRLISLAYLRTITRRASILLNRSQPNLTPYKEVMCLISLPLACLAAMTLLAFMGQLNHMALLAICSNNESKAGLL